VSNNPDPPSATHPDLRPTTHVVSLAVLRVIVSIAGLVTLYYLLPLDHSSTSAAVTVLILGLMGFIALIIYQVRSIIRAQFPGLRAIEALATSIPLFLLLFASSYITMAHISASNFGGCLTHTDGLYFTVTTFSTVGFGDITAKSQAARLVVTGQMMADLVVLGVAVKVIVGAVSRARQQRTPEVGGNDPAPTTPRSA
jgi:hypothetical protein